MDSIAYYLDSASNFSKEEKDAFVKLLQKQGKVKDPSITKLDQCKFLGICKVDDEIVSIGAIKPKTKSDFSIRKANLPMLGDLFDLELGYCFTLKEHSGKGHSTKIVQLLVNSVEKENLMASTELKNGNAMHRILERNNFKFYGTPWKSLIHGGVLGLFLRIVK